MYNVVFGFIIIIAHALSEYVKLFRVEKSSGNQDSNNAESQSSNSEEEPEPKPEPLPDDMLDTFAFMMMTNDVQVWNFGFLVFFIQAGLSIMILTEQVLFSEGN